MAGFSTSLCLVGRTQLERKSERIPKWRESSLEHGLYVSLLIYRNDTNKDLIRLQLWLRSAGSNISFAPYFLVFTTSAVFLLRLPLTVYANAGPIAGLRRRLMTKANKVELRYYNNNYYCRYVFSRNNSLCLYSLPSASLQTGARFRLVCHPSLKCGRLSH